MTNIDAGFFGPTFIWPCNLLDERYNRKNSRSKKEVRVEALPSFPHQLRVLSPVSILHKQAARSRFSVSVGLPPALTPSNLCGGHSILACRFFVRADLSRDPTRSDRQTGDVEVG
jgi:hypothetical protein